MPTAKKPIEYTVTVTVVMIADKPTPDTFRFKEITEKGQAPRIGTLYIPRETPEEMDNLSDDPDPIEVTIRKYV